MQELREARMSKAVSLHDFVVSKIRDMIVDGDLKPGTCIDEMRLAAELDVSRSPVREALKVLRSEGIVEFRARQGARVIQQTPKSIRDLYEVLANLEAAAIQYVCARAPDHEINELVDMNAAMRSHYERRNLRLYTALNQEIHERIVIFSANKVLEEIYSGVTSRARMARFGVEMTEARWTQAMDEHDMITQALRERDGTTAARMIHDHALVVSDLFCRQMTALEIALN